MAKGVLLAPEAARRIIRHVREAERYGQETLRSKRRIRTGTGTLWRVRVAVDGGSPGSATEQCSFTYEVTSLNDEVVLTEATPERPRPPVGRMIAPPPGSTGWVYHNGTEVILWDVGEVLSLGCEEPAGA